MADTTAIAWTDHTFNPWMGCMKVSPGCKNCYAETLTAGRMGLGRLWGPTSKSTRQVTSVSNWKKPASHNKKAAADRQSRRVFCASLCDVFEDHPIAHQARPRLWDLIRATPWLDWQLLTKRPENFLRYLPGDWGITGFPNVWLGTSIEDADYVHRADELRQVPAVVHFISYEPALGPLAHALNLTGIEWLIYGGESGPGYRPHDVQWARDIRAACHDAGTAFFYKQSAAPRTEMGITLDGHLVRAYPMARRTETGHMGAYHGKVNAQAVPWGTR